MNNLGKKLSHLIKSNSMKQRTLAEILGISPSRLSNYISGKREPSIEVLDKIASVLGVDLNYFSKNSPAKYRKSRKLKESGYIEAVFFNINSKKLESKDKKIKINEIFLKSINEPQENAVVVLINGKLSHIPKGSIIIGEKFRQNHPIGSIVLEIGRNFKIHKLETYDNNPALMLFDGNNTFGEPKFFDKIKFGELHYIKVVTICSNIDILNNN